MRRRPAKAAAGALGAFAKDFTAALPPGAETGAYAASNADRFAGRSYKIADGMHAAGGWRFEFRGGRFVQAIEDHRTHLSGGGDGH